MSYATAKAALNLGMTDRIPYWGCLPFQTDFLGKCSGMDPCADPVQTSLKVIEKCGMSAVGGIFTDIPREAELRESEAEYDKENKIGYTRNLGWGKSTWREHTTFKTIEQVLEFDPTGYDTKNIDDIIAECKKSMEDAGNMQKIVGERAWLIPPAGFYNTLFMWPIECFGWEMFLMTAAQEPEKFGRLLEKFAQISLKYISAWASCANIELFQSHDDLASTKGPMLNPEWYKKYIFPLYPQIWKPLKDKGIKILFRGDGNMDEFTDDLVKCGVDGFHFRRETNLKRLAEKYGKDKIIVGNISTQVLTFKGRKEIEDEVKRCVLEAGNCPGYFLNVAGEIPYNVPTENIEFLFEAIKKYGRR
ncbi:MAG: hypothetical protein KJ964_13565 [Verrucomicrobia bacterium]|nr:hypothetical protein [Verrucomicrobiota bacterium]MBU1736437.1 hypothetical protein [Verrucomicrobiota bacterium]MBU1857191.1 hypothetical protein [Verrucomicrobiota bacterium]